MTLSIPAIKPDEDIIRAAIAYATAGWYVLPVDPNTKRPASFLGKGWQHQSSRDPHEIAAWFAGTDHQVGLHVGRSGAVVLDVDNFDAFPTDLRPHLTGVPFQSTRIDDAYRGHYVFTVPPGRVLGNSRGRLPKEFGEVRGTNGIIVVAPSVHVKVNGQYLWRTFNGDVPVLPGEISDLLPDGQVADDAVTDEAVKAFLDEHTGNDSPALLKAVLRSFAEEAAGSSRHEALVRHLVWAMREARAGLYPARTAMDALWQDFDAFLTGEVGRFPRSEFRGIMAWAVAQALAIDPAQRANEIQERLAERDARKEAAVATTAPALIEEWTPPHKPADYFGTEGIDVQLAATDVLSAGPLAWGRDGAFWSYADGVWSSEPHAVEKRVVRLLGARFRGSHATNIATVTRHQVGTIDCDPHPDYMNFSNGMLNWRTGEILPHAPHYGSTVQFPIAWEPNATCPKFDAFLQQVLTPDYIDLAWEMLGYMLFSGNPLQKAFLFYGSGRNGKGTLMRVIEGLLGTRNVSAVSLDSLNTNRFASASLFGRIANLAGDIDATFQESTAKFKQLTGGDVLDAEEKHRQSFRFTSWAVPVFSANKIPGSADTSFGYLRRWVVIHFTKTISDEEVDPDLDEKLAVELPGVAAHAVASLRTLMERRNFENKGEVAQGHADFAEVIDQVRQWIVQCTIPVTGNAENARACYDDYKVWAAAEGNRPLRSSEFYLRLENAGYPKRKSGTYVVDGLRISPSRVRMIATDSATGEQIPLPPEPAAEEDR